MRGGNLRWWMGGMLATAAVGACLWSVAGGEEKPADPAVARARRQIEILDHLYKSMIVLITDNYVTEEADLAAGAAFQKVFDSVKQKGYHEVRLLDATGEPYDKDNVPRDEFEKAAIAALKGGKPYYEQIVEKDGKRYLRAATPIPVVLEKCTICHPHYEKAKPGQAIGALGYSLLIE
jgi:hypothetical protein